MRPWIGAAIGLAALWTAGAMAAPLPEPYAAWNVTVVPSDEGPGAFTVSYDSPLLGHRAVNSVYLPARYSKRGAPLPVLYYLHGTVLPFVDFTRFDPLTCVESFLCMVSGGGGKKQAELQDFTSQRNRAEFVVVAPDTDPDKSWCETCWWIDGRDDLIPNRPPMTAQTVPAETVLYTEVLPLIEHLYNVRHDRGGRGVIGFSMGAGAAALQAFRHPDRFVYMGSISGMYDMVGDPVLRLGLDGAGYFRDQGYPSSITAEIWWRNFNPHDLAVNQAGAGTKLMFSRGDICLPPTDAEGRADCRKYPSARNPLGAGVEQVLGSNVERTVTQIPADGLQADLVHFSGIHGANNHRVYAEVIVPQANAVFAGGVTTSDTFGYRIVDAKFGVWGYRVSVERERDEFLEMVDARHDATGFGLRGSGRVTVKTPAVFRANGAYRLRVLSAEGDVVTRHPVNADANGRIGLVVNLDDAAFRTDSSPFARVEIERR